MQAYEAAIESQPGIPPGERGLWDYVSSTSSSLVSLAALRSEAGASELAHEAARRSVDVWCGPGEGAPKLRAGLTELDEVAYQLLRQGRRLGSLGFPDEAERALLLSRSAWLSVAPSDLGGTLSWVNSQGLTLGHLGNIRLDGRRVADAYRAYDEAIQLYERHLSTVPTAEALAPQAEERDDTRVIGICYYNLACCLARRSTIASPDSLDPSGPAERDRQASDADRGLAALWRGFQYAPMAREDYEDDPDLAPLQSPGQS